MTVEYVKAVKDKTTGAANAVAAYAYVDDNVRDSTLAEALRGLVRVLTGYETAGHDPGDPQKPEKGATNGRNEGQDTLTAGGKN